MKEQKYSKEWMIAQLERKERIKYVFFWGHQVSQEVSNSCFSQWYESPFAAAGEVYRTAEHWMMAEKARLFGDQEVLKEILATEKAAKAKGLGRAIKNFDNELWEAARFNIVVQGSLHKFKANPEMGAYLLGTGSRVLVEASPIDAIWGIGMAKDHKKAYDPSSWRGLNLLGFALMEARDQLQKVSG